MANPHRAQHSLEDAGLHFGIVGTLAFMVFVLIFREDWTHRFAYLIYLLPLPLASLLVARRLPWLGGLLLIALSTAVTVFDFFFSPGHPGQIAGRGLGYTLVFVAMPLAVSGFFYSRLWWKTR